MSIPNQDLGMALQRKQVIANIQGLAPQIRRHILKLIIWPHSLDENHWTSELVNWIGTLRELTVKPNSRKVSVELYNVHLHHEADFDAEVKYVHETMGGKKLVGERRKQVHEVYNSAIRLIADWAALPILDDRARARE